MVTTISTILEDEMPQSTLKVTTEISRLGFLGAYTNLQGLNVAVVQSFSTSGNFLRCRLDDLPTDAATVMQMQCEAQWAKVGVDCTVRQGFYYNLEFDYENHFLNDTNYLVKQNAWDTLSPDGEKWTVAIVNATAIELHKVDSVGDGWCNYAWAYCDWQEAGGSFFWQWWAPILLGLKTLGHCLKMEDAERLIQHLQHVIRGAGCLHVPITQDHRRLMEQLPLIVR